MNSCLRPFGGRRCLINACEQRGFALQVITHQVDQHKHIASFHSQHRSVNFGYSISGFHCVVLTLHPLCHGWQWDSHLQARCQAVSTFLVGQEARELNFTDMKNE
jgi:hypothetical protein